MDAAAAALERAGLRARSTSAMRIHHLNCGTKCPLGGRPMNDDGPLEPGSTLELVDSGSGADDVQRLGAFDLER